MSELVNGEHDISSGMKEISHISQILDIIHELHGVIIIAFDWDNCISLVDSCNLPLRDPLNPNNSYENGDGSSVLTTFNEINEMGVPFFVITSRLKGYSIDNLIRTNNLFSKSHHTMYSRRVHTIECIKNDVRAMHQAIPVLSPQSHSHPLPGLNPDEPNVIIHKKNGAPYAASIIFENVIFAGSHRPAYPSNKGYALINYMALGILPPATDFDYIIFVDNEFKHIKNAQTAFGEAGIRHKLIPVYYPQNPPLDARKNQELCEQTHFIDDCLRR